MKGREGAAREGERESFRRLGRPLASLAGRPIPSCCSPPPQRSACATTSSIHSCSRFIPCSAPPCSALSIFPYSTLFPAGPRCPRSAHTFHDNTPALSPTAESISESHARSRRSCRPASSSSPGRPPYAARPSHHAQNTSRTARSSRRALRCKTSGWGEPDAWWWPIHHTPRCLVSRRAF